MSTRCKECSKSVYPMDPQINLDGTLYHKGCAKCTDCNCQITLSNFAKSETSLLCKTHYIKRFKEEGRYSGEEKFSTKSNRGNSVSSFEVFNLMTRSASSAEMKVASTETKWPSNTSCLPTLPPDRLVHTAPISSPPSSPSKSAAKFPFRDNNSNSNLDSNFTRDSYNNSSTFLEQDAPRLSVSVKELIAARQSKVSATSAPLKIGTKSPAPAGGLPDTPIPNSNNVIRV